MKLAIAIGVALILFAALGIYSMTGAGAFKRMVTISGIYAICKPDGYDAVCFLDADKSKPGLSCLPLAQAGGKCNPK